MSWKTTLCCKLLTTLLTFRLYSHMYLLLMSSKASFFLHLVTSMLLAILNFSPSAALLAVFLQPLRLHVPISLLSASVKLFDWKFHYVILSKLWITLVAFFFKFLYVLTAYVLCSFSLLSCDVWYPHSVQVNLFSI